MDIGSGKGRPGSTLSNFAPHPFVIDGVQCASMEGFLQSLKFKNPEMQKYVCTLVGRKAKFKGKKKKWWKLQVLYWRGNIIDRHEHVYQDLLDRAYECMYAQSSSFRRALTATNKAVFTHSLGSSDSNRTVLTTREFCSRLTGLRAYVGKVRA
jgi:predicted NAD-dependent protein-ADP-ribosyltransferase YbiA (DUF1768 family)